MSDVRVELQHLSKMFRTYRNPRNMVLGLLGLPVSKRAYNEFWALRDVQLRVKKGDRLGIVGRNGAGKTTLLKLIAGQLQPTDGEIEVNGDVQALMDLGTGFYPEFTGRQNVFAALGYQAIGGKEARERFEEIVEFTELGAFIDNPFKTYSAGMKARLTFAVATAIEPEILIIDEVLGAGDGYFMQKSAERMSRLVGGDASVMLVSHALDQITRFCDQAIWIERGKIVMRGSSLEVLKSYNQFLNVLDERRLAANNWRKRNKREQPGDYDKLYHDMLEVRFHWRSTHESELNIGSVRLEENEEVVEQLDVGDAQDTNRSHPAWVVLDATMWSEPRQSGERFHRSLKRSPDDNAAVGRIVFYAYSLFDNLKYDLEWECRADSTGELDVIVVRNGETLAQATHEVADGGWTSLRQLIRDPNMTDSPTDRGHPATASGLPASRHDGAVGAPIRWPGLGSVQIQDVTLLDESGNERPVFESGERLVLILTMVARSSGTYRVIPAITIHRLDGIPVSNHIYDNDHEFVLEAGQQRVFHLDFDRLLLAEGHYFISAALFREEISESERYDVIDRSYEFKVTGDDSPLRVVFHHPATWTFEDNASLSGRKGPV